MALRKHSAAPTFKTKPFARLLLATCIVLVHSQSLASQSNPSPSPEVDSSITQPDLVTLRDRINAGEATEAISILEANIDDVLKESSPYDAKLIDMYLLLGDANYHLDQYANALSAYSLASDVSRIANGLYSTSHIGIAYREANMLARMGAWQSANNRHEYAYSIVLREYED